MKLNKFFLFFLVLIQSCSLFSEVEEEFEPLYAGTLLAFFPENAEPGHLAVQPYLFVTNRNGLYNKNWHYKSQKNINTVDLLVSLETGITKKVDVTLYLNGQYSTFRGKHSVEYGDTDIFLGFQIAEDKKRTSIPDVRFLLGESFPTGKYKNLSPSKGGSDASGTGSYETFFIFVTQKIFYSIPKHPFNINLNLIYVLTTKTHIEGLSVFGGGVGTKGTVIPGNQFVANLGYEFSITRNWGWGVDFRYQHNDHSVFYPTKGNASNALQAGLPSSEIFSIAPSLEYNFSKEFSIEGGVWFTVGGRNAPSFVSGVANVYYYF